MFIKNIPKQESFLTVFWFRRDLRLHDNRGLYEALNRPFPVLPVFIFDKNILSKLPCRKDKRISFIHRTLKELNDKLAILGSSLLVMHDEPLSAFKKICRMYKVREVITNNDYEPYAVKRDAQIAEFLKKNGIAFNSFKDQVIFERSDVMKADGKPYTVYTPYSVVWKQKLNVEKIRSYQCDNILKRLARIGSFPFPSLEDIGFRAADISITPSKPDREIIRNYHLNRNFPGVNGTSRLSLHLRFGTVSIRELVRLATELNEQWLNELIWREFFMMIIFHFPDVVTKNFKRKYDFIPWRNNENEFNLWCRGETGYPMVDAGMRELNETGFMHNRVRMITAGFLTKHLLIDWRWGEAYFAEKLLDFEISANNGNWQWAASTGCDAVPYFRIFNPSEQAKKFDPELLYIKKWISDYHHGYLPQIVEHAFARNRALEIYGKRNP